MRSIACSAVVLVAAAIVCIPSLSISNDRPPSPPDWVFDHWSHLTKGSGTWAADNAAYQSEQEPYREYRTAWTYGLGNMSLTGRLFGVIDSVDAGTFWTFRSVWHPKEERLVELQFGGDGTFGMGESYPVNDALYEHVMTFYAPDGSSYRVGHRTTIVNGDQHMQSYQISPDGEWTEQRFYIWKRLP